MIVNTTYFGSMTIEESSTIEFPQGLPGFEHCRRFVPLQRGDSPGLIFLQDLEQPQLCFVTVVVRGLWPDYGLAISADDCELLGMDAAQTPVIGRDVVVLAIVSFAEGEEPTVNLLAPLVVHLGTRRAVQAIRPDGRYQVREGLPVVEPVCS